MLIDDLYNGDLFRNSMGNVYFFQIKEIAKDSLLLDEVKKQGIFFSYFQVDKEYYLILYNKKLIEIDSFLTNTDIIKELNSKKRKIRSLKGFLLYALEIMENGENYKILSTNLSEFFWKNLKDNIRQNQKGALEKFLFKESLTQSINDFNLQNEIKYLRTKLAFSLDKDPELETKNSDQVNGNKISENRKSDTKEPAQVSTR